MKKTIVLITLCLLISLMLIIKFKNKTVYVNNEKLKICQKCIVINDKYYCQVYGINEGSDK